MFTGIAVLRMCGAGKAGRGTQERVGGRAQAGGKMKERETRDELLDDTPQLQGATLSSSPPTDPDPDLRQSIVSVVS